MLIFLLMAIILHDGATCSDVSLTYGPHIPSFENLELRQFSWNINFFQWPNQQVAWMELVESGLFAWC